MMSFYISSISAAQPDGEETPLASANIRKNLLTDLDGCDAKLNPSYVQVYVRVRPLIKDEVERGENQSCLQVVGNNSILVHAPKDSHTYRTSNVTNNKVQSKYSFSRVFDQTTSQKQFFDDTMLTNVKEFIDGQNSLTFTYGVTNSGKTYTIQGEPSDAGILPRALDVIFNSIGSRRYQHMNIKPDMFCGVLKLTRQQELQEIAAKDAIMKMTLGAVERESACLSRGVSNDSLASSGSSSADPFCSNSDLMSEDSLDQIVAVNQTSATPSKHAHSDNEEGTPEEDISTVVANRKREDTVVDVRSQGHIKYSVWVSFAEIYQEQIFDLLIPPPKKKLSRRVQLQLREDKNGQPYIKGLKEINVNSADEAYRLLTLGKRNLQFASTKVNQSSSRSHCIFTIKMIRVADKEDAKYARVSMLSLCDLAGSERLQKTGNMGDRLKEASVINNSLMCLSHCIKTLRSNQTARVPKLVPFRDSKLTRLFQSYFTGHGKASMIVNISPCSSMFDETLYAIKYSAIAKQVIVAAQQPMNQMGGTLLERAARLEELEEADDEDLATNRPRNTIGWVSPGSYGQLIADGMLSVSLALPSAGAEGGERRRDDLNDRALLDRRSIAVVRESTSLVDQSDESASILAESVLEDEDEEDVDVDELRALWTAEREQLVKVIKDLRELLIAQMAEKNKLEQNLRIEICEEFKALFVKMEEDHQTDMMTQEEIHEERMDSRINLLQEAIKKASKRQRVEDDDDEYVSSQLLHAEQVKLQRVETELEELKERLRETEREVRERSDELCKMNKDRETMSVRLNRAQFDLTEQQKKYNTLHNSHSECEKTLSDLREELRIATTSRSADNQELQKELVTLKKELVALQNSSKTAEEKLQQKTEEAEEIDRRFEEIVSGLERDLREKVEVIKDTEEDKLKLLEKIESLERNVECEKEKCLLVEEQKKTLNSKVNELESELDKKEETSAKEEEKLKGLKDEVQELLKKLEKERAEHLEVKEERQKLFDEVKELETRLTSENDTRVNADQSRKGLEERIKELERDLKAEKEERVNVEKERSGLVERVKEVELDLEKEKDTNTKIEQDKQSPLDKVNELKQGLSSEIEGHTKVDKEKQELLDKVNNLESTLVKEKQLYSDLKAENVTLKDKMVGLDKEVEAGKGLIAEMSEAKEYLSSDMDKLKEDMEKQMNKNTEISDKLSQQTNKQIEELKIKLESRESELSEANERLKASEELCGERIESVEESSEERMEEMAKRLEDYEKEIGDLKRGHEKDIIDLKRLGDQEKEIRDLNRDHEKKIEDLKRNQEKEIGDLKRLLEDERRRDCIRCGENEREREVRDRESEREMTSLHEQIHRVTEENLRLKQSINESRQIANKQQVPEENRSVLSVADKSTDKTLELSNVSVLANVTIKREPESTPQRTTGINGFDNHMTDTCASINRNSAAASDSVTDCVSNKTTNKTIAANTVTAADKAALAAEKAALAPPASSSKQKTKKSSNGSAAASEAAVARKIKQELPEPTEPATPAAAPVATPAAAAPSAVAAAPATAPRSETRQSTRKQTRQASNKLANIKYIDDDDDDADVNDKDDENYCDENEFENIYSKNVRKSTRKTASKSTASKLSLAKRVEATDSPLPCPRLDMTPDPTTTRSARSCRTRKTATSVLTAQDSKNNAAAVETAEEEACVEEDKKGTREKSNTNARKRKHTLHNTDTLKQLTDTPNEGRRSGDLDTVAPSPHTIVSRSLRTRKH